MAGESLFFWLGASADAETGSRASHRANSAVVSTRGFDPARDRKWFGPLMECDDCGQMFRGQSWHSICWECIILDTAE